jgi:hypothetical protein
LPDAGQGDGEWCGVMLFVIITMNYRLC